MFVSSHIGMNLPHTLVQLPSQYGPACPCYSGTAETLQGAAIARRARLLTEIDISDGLNSCVEDNKILSDGHIFSGNDVSPINDRVLPNGDVFAGPQSDGNCP